MTHLDWRGLYTGKFPLLHYSCRPNGYKTAFRIPYVVMFLCSDVCTYCFWMNFRKFSEEIVIPICSIHVTKYTCAGVGCGEGSGTRSHDTCVVLWSLSTSEWDLVWGGIVTEFLRDDNTDSSNVCIAVDSCTGRSSQPKDDGVGDDYGIKEDDWTH